MPLPAREDPLVGTTVDGRYRIVERIGEGGAGVLYRAEQLTVGREVALKMLSGFGMTDERAVRRFENEARIVSQLRHPSTLKLFDFGRMDNGQPYFVCELLRGAALNRILERDGPLSVKAVLGYLIDICTSLEEAHALGVIHRDLKPANIFIEKVGEEEIAKVLDFGIAKIIHQESVTAVGTFIGTPAYMPPEASTERPLDARSDIYSLGVTAFECLAGRRPYTAEIPMAVLQMHAYHPVPSLRSFAPDREIPRELESLVYRMMAKDPRQRPQTAADVRMEVEAIARKIASPKTPAQKSPQHWVPKLVGLAILLGVFSAAIAQWTRPAQPNIAIAEPLRVHPPTPKPVVGEEAVDEEPVVEEEAVVTPPPRRPEPRELPKTKRARKTKAVEPPRRAHLTVEVWTTAGRILPAQVWIDGNRLAGATANVEGGLHVVEVMPDGYPRQKKTVDVRSDREMTVRFVAD